MSIQGLQNSNIHTLYKTIETLMRSVIKHRTTKSVIKEICQVMLPHTLYKDLSSYAPSYTDSPKYSTYTQNQ